MCREGKSVNSVNTLPNEKGAGGVRMLAGGTDYGMSHSLFRVSQDSSAFPPCHHIRGGQGSSRPRLHVKNQGETRASIRQNGKTNTQIRKAMRNSLASTDVD